MRPNKTKQKTREKSGDRKKTLGRRAGPTENNKKRTQGRLREQKETEGIDLRKEHHKGDLSEENPTRMYKKRRASEKKIVSSDLLHLEPQEKRRGL